MTNKTAPAVLIALLFVGASIIALQHNDEAQTTQDEMESNDLPPIPLVKRTTQGIQASDDIRIELQNDTYVDLEFYRNSDYECGLSGIYSFMVMNPCLLYTSPSPRDVEESRMPSSA